MLSEAYKQEALEYVKNISPQELERILIEIGSKRVDDGNDTCGKSTKEDEG